MKAPIAGRGRIPLPEIFSNPLSFFRCRQHSSLKPTTHSLVALALILTMGGGKDANAQFGTSLPRAMSGNRTGPTNPTREPTLREAIKGLTGQPLLEPPATTAVERQLRQRFTLDRSIHTLPKLTARLSGVGIQVWVDQRALDDAGIDENVKLATPYMVKVRVKDALRHLLPSVDLTYVSRPAGILITTPDMAESEYQVTRVFNVTSLCPPGSGDVDDLINMITSTIRPDSWDEVGGPGSVNSLTPRGDQTLIALSQSEEVMEQVSGLLLAIYRILGPSGAIDKTMGLRRSSLRRTTASTTLSPFNQLTPDGMKYGGFF